MVQRPSMTLRAPKPAGSRLVPAEVDEWCAVAVEEIQVLERKAVLRGFHEDNDGVAHQLLATGGGDGRHVQRAGRQRGRTDGLATSDVGGHEFGPPRTIAAVEVVGEARVPQ